MYYITNFIRYINVSLTAAHSHKLTQDIILLISRLLSKVDKTSVDITSDSSVIHEINNVIVLVDITPNRNVVLYIHLTDRTMVYVSLISIREFQQSSVR